MFSVDEALAKILTAFQLLPAESVPLSEALGRTLAAEVIAAHSLPPFANSSMDGYALRAADTVNASPDSPRTLTVIGDIPAGVTPQLHVGPGQAARIMTGAAIPDGADAVVQLELTTTPPGPEPLPLPPTVGILKAVAPGNNVRAVGEDVQAGATVLKAGRKLRPADVGILAALGLPRVSVIRRPVVAIFSTGDELLAPGEALQPGKIYDANSYTISAMVTEAGGKPVALGILPDQVAAVEAAFKTAAHLPADLILTSAGVSVGAFDVVKTAVNAHGALNFWKVNLRPGKPLAFGQVRGVPFMGLPGNPVSAMVTFEVFVRPALMRMLGLPEATPTSLAELATPLTSDGRRTYARVRLERRGERLIAYSTGSQNSNVLTSLVHADGLLIIPEGMTEAPTGAQLPVRLLREPLPNGS